MSNNMNIKEEINKKAIYWLNKQSEGLTNQEQIEFETWLNSNIHHQTIYEEHKNLREACINLPDEYLKSLDEQIQEDSNKISNLKKLKTLAASLVFVIISTFAYFEIQDYYSVQYSNLYVTSNEKKSNIILPDDSIVDLDIKSQIDVNYYSSKRQITFSNGKALFSVKSDKKRPFIITAGNTTIEVIGTKFEVVNLNNITTISVIEGIVKIGHIFNKDKDSKTISLLKKGEKLSINNQGKVLELGKTIVKNIATWKDDLIVFNKTSLHEAMKAFERYTNKKSKFETTEIAHFEITGSFSTKDLDKFLNALPLIYPLKIEKSKENIKFFEKN